MRRALYLASVTALLCIAATFGYRTYRDYAQSEQCLEDTVRFVRELYDIRKATADEPSVGAYRFQQHVTDARRHLSPWFSDPQPERRRIIETASGALFEFEGAAQLYMQLQHRADKETVAEFTVKIDSGRQRLAEVAAAVHKHPPPLTAAAKQRLVEHIDRVFGAELAKQSASKEDPQAEVYWEIVAVSLIKRALLPENA